MWHWRGLGFWVFPAVVLPFGVTELIERFLLGHPLPRGTAAVNFAIAGCLCIALALYARRLPPEPANNTSDDEVVDQRPLHSLQGLSVLTWAFVFFGLGAFAAWHTVTK